MDSEALLEGQEEAGMSRRDKQAGPSRKRSANEEKLVLYVRSIVCNYAGIIHNCGVWNLLDTVIVRGWFNCSGSVHASLFYVVLYSTMQSVLVM